MDSKKQVSMNIDDYVVVDKMFIGCLVYSIGITIAMLLAWVAFLLMGIAWLIK